MKLRFRDDLKAEIEARGMSQSEFALAAGLSLASVSRAARKELISPLVFGKIIRGLGAVAPVISNGRVASVAKVAGKTRGTPSGVKR